MNRRAFKLAPISLSVLLSLTGCIEVDDSGNKQVVASLNQQNAILAEQNELLSQQLSEQVATITISGAVFDLDTFKPISGTVASVQVLKGETVLVEQIQTEDGLFSIEGLPASSDLTLYVTFSDNAFVNRAFFITTPPAAEDVVFDDIGYLDVSKPLDVVFSVIDTDTGEAVPDLHFSGTSHSGTSSYSTAYNYQHETTFDADEGVYRITLPKYLDVTLRANLDLDGDGEMDYDIAVGNHTYIAGDRLTITSANELQNEVISLSVDDDPIIETKLVYVTLLDESGLPVEGASFVNSLNDMVISEYQTDSSRYVISTDFNGYASLSMPAFEHDGVTYSTGQITIDRNSSASVGDYLRIYTSGFNSNSGYSIDDTETISIVLVAKAVTDSFDVEMVTSFFSAQDYTYTVYYSEPVVLADAEVSLTFENVEVVAGNASSTDSVPAGFTYISTVQQSTAVNILAELNNTKFTLSPDAALNSNTEYTYDIGSLTAPTSSAQVDLYGDTKEFTTPVDSANAFDINDVYVDNANFFSNGTVLVSENTAGVASNDSESYSSVYLHLPTSIESLNYLIFNMTGYTESGNEYTDSRQMNAVLDNEVSAQKKLGVSAARNEEIRYDTYVNYLVGSTMENGTYEYRLHTGQYLRDNTPSNVNSISFNYEYQTLDGETVSGKLTLPVL